MTKNRAKGKELRAESKIPSRLPNDIQFVAIGHFTHDVVGSELILGGAASYSSIAASGLGLRTGVISAVGADFLHYERFNGISLAFVDSGAMDNLTTTLQNT